MMTSSEDADVEMWVNQIQSQIIGCDNCQPFEDSGDEDDGGLQSVEEFLYDNEVPEELHDAIAEQLVCRCGHSLELDSGIVVDEIESQPDVIAADRFGDWAAEDNPRLGAFVDHLRQFPNAGLDHEVGVDLLNQLKALKTTTITGNWWRAQNVKESECPPSVARMGPPPAAGSTGRLHGPDQRAFYLGSDKSAAVNEARKYLQADRQMWIQQFRITGVENVIELQAPLSRTAAFYRDDIPLLFAGLMWCDGLVQQRVGSEQAKEYLLPQFISKCATSIGIAGITFNSLLHEGTNLVLFKWTDEIVSPIGEPERISDIAEAG
ncbi:MAG TPA: RES family NAD+ phosphorylase [Pirellulales bacterium]